MNDLSKLEKVAAPSLHAVKVARDRLIESLSQGIEEYGRNGKCPSGDEICKGIEQFVVALSRVLGGKEELHRRSCFVEEQCKPGSKYASNEV